MLRPWRTEDLEPFAALNADPEVMEHFPSTLSREESDAGAGRIASHFENRGFGLWAVEVPGYAPFIGYIGLVVPWFEVPFESRSVPCVEIGWRLARSWWGRGLAAEGARAVLAFGFEHLSFSEIVSFTVPGNRRSRRVMEKLGMQYSEDFEHPGLDPGHPLRRHVLYRLAHKDWVLPRRTI
jgi:RimJ/RimL family protein N-acetyltransferase